MLKRHRRAWRLQLQAGGRKWIHVGYMFQTRFKANHCFCEGTPVRHVHADSPELFTAFTTFAKFCCVFFIFALDQPAELAVKIKPPPALRVDLPQPQAMTPPTNHQILSIFVRMYMSSFFSLPVHMT